MLPLRRYSYTYATIQQPATSRLPPAQAATQRHQAARHQQRVDQPHPPRPQTAVAPNPHRKSIRTASSVGLLGHRLLRRECDDPTHGGDQDIVSG